MINTTELLKIPPFPPVASKLLRITATDEIGARDLVRLLRSDPALSATIIRHANSPLYSLTTEVKALEHAISLLGIGKIRRLALAAVTRTYVLRQHGGAVARVLAV
jgi:HD-like signal output (HDOD) protein